MLVNRIKILFIFVLNAGSLIVFVALVAVFIAVVPVLRQLKSSYKIAKYLAANSTN